MAPWMMQMQQQIELPVLVVTSHKETKVSGANVILAGIFDKNLGNINMTYGTLGDEATNMTVSIYQGYYSNIPEASLCGVTTPGLPVLVVASPKEAKVSGAIVILASFFDKISLEI
jgi:hypothetical protein